MFFLRWEHILPLKFFCTLSTWSVKYPIKEAHKIHSGMKTNCQKPLRAMFAF